MYSPAPDNPIDALLTWMCATASNPDRLRSALKRCRITLNTETLQVATPPGEFELLKPIHLDLLAAAARFQLEPVELRLLNGDRLISVFRSEELWAFLERVDRKP